MVTLKIILHKFLYKISLIWSSKFCVKRKLLKICLCIHTQKAPLKPSANIFTNYELLHKNNCLKPAVEKYIDFTINVLSILLASSLM